MYPRDGDILSAHQVFIATVSTSPMGVDTFGSMAESESGPKPKPGAASSTTLTCASVHDVALVWAGIAEVDLQDGEVAKAHATLCEGVTAADAWLHQQ